MSKKNSLFEVVLTTLSSLTKNDAASDDDSLALGQVYFIEGLLKKAALSAMERTRADAALYKVLTTFNQHPSEKGIWHGARTIVLPLVGESSADKQLQKVIAKLDARHGKRPESMV